MYIYNSSLSRTTQPALQYVYMNIYVYVYVYLYIIICIYISPLSLVQHSQKNEQSKRKKEKSRNQKNEKNSQDLRHECLAVLCCQHPQADTYENEKLELRVINRK